MNGNKQRKLKQAEQSYKFTRKQMKQHLEKGVRGVKLTTVDMVLGMPEVKLDQNIYPSAFPSFKQQKVNQLITNNMADQKSKKLSNQTSKNRTKLLSRIESNATMTIIENKARTDGHSSANVPKLNTLYGQMEFEDNESDHLTSPYELNPTVQHGEKTIHVARRGT